MIKALDILVGLIGGFRATIWFAAMLALGTAAGVQSWRLDHAQAAHAKAEKAAFLAQFAASESARKEEQSRVQAVDAIARAYERGKSDGKAAADTVLAGVADGTYVLRDRFRCQAPRPAAETPAGPAVSGGAEGAGLSGEDVQFLVRFAAEADDVVRQLTACQAVTEADRAIQN